MIPVLTPAEMAEVDGSAPEPVDVLVARAGLALALAARRMMGGAYGRAVVVVAGPGNNGADGRVAARRLRSWGAGVAVVDPATSPLPEADLVIDAAYGTGLSRAYAPPDPGSTPVLAADIPSGLSGLDGTGDSMTAERTVTFAAYKPGLLLGSGRDRCGTVEVADLGLGALAAARASAWVVEDGDVVLPPRSRWAHKWQAAVMVVGGSDAMPGAPLLAASAALRAGAGYALVGIPGAGRGGGLPPGPHVGLDLPGTDWAGDAVRAAARVGAVVAGPGLGRRAAAVSAFLTEADVPAVVDADGLTSLVDLDRIRAVVRARRAPVVLTPHEGEYERITGHVPEADRIADVRRTAAHTGAVVLLKGSTTVVAAPDGRVLLSASGDSRLATAGTGDVLSGVIGAFLARGLPAFEAAGLAAHTHGRAAAAGRSTGLVATDLPELVSDWLSGRKA